MKKKYAGFWRGMENIGISLGMTALLLFVRLLQGHNLAAGEIKNMAVTYFSATLLFTAGLLFLINIMNWYYFTEPLKISMGCTRRQVFMDMQMTKLCSALGIFAVVLAVTRASIREKDMQWILSGFVVLLLLQAAGELVILVWIRFRKMGIILLTAVSACFGFFVAYAVAEAVKHGVLEVTFYDRFLTGNSVAGILFSLVVYHILMLLSWKLWKKAEIRF